MPNPEIKTTTQNHLDIEDIRDGMVILKNGEVAAILTTTAVNFALLSEREQDALISAFSMLLNSITYPIQVVIRSKRIDISNYLKRVIKTEKGLEDPLLKKQAQSYRKFVQNIVKTNEVLAKNFYIVIPAGTAKQKVRGSTPFDWLEKLTGKHTKRINVNVDQVLNKAKPNLLPKVDHITGEFRRLGIKARQLKTQEIVELYFEMYNPETSQTQKLRTDINDYKTGIVEPAIIGE